MRIFLTAASLLAGLSLSCVASADAVKLSPRVIKETDNMIWFQRAKKAGVPRDVALAARCHVTPASSMSDEWVDICFSVMYGEGYDVYMKRVETAKKVGLID